MTAQLFLWEPPSSASNIWYTLTQHSRCCIIDNGTWRTIALSSESTPTYVGSDWQQLPTLSASDPKLTGSLIPPFLEGYLSIISFDGHIHVWYANYSISHHTPTDQWFIWADPTKYDEIQKMAWLSPQRSVSNEILTQSSMSKEMYQEKVGAIIGEIRKGNVYQINLAHQIGPFNISNPVEFWNKLMEKNPAQFGCYWQTPTEILICNSPELFLRFDQNSGIQSIPIKGTHKDLGNPNSHQELWTSEKEHSELTMIVDMMRNDISRVSCIGSVFTENRRLRRCGDLLHAEQKVLGKLRPEFSIWDAVQACFPPASVTGAPKIAAIEYIKQMETINRDWYTGSFGWWDFRGTSDWNVLIRTIQCGPIQEDNSAVGHLNIGAGIVFDSIPEQEWEETLAKSRAIQNILNQL